MIRSRNGFCFLTLSWTTSVFWNVGISGLKYVANWNNFGVEKRLRKVWAVNKCVLRMGPCLIWLINFFLPKKVGYSCLGLAVYLCFGVAVHPLVAPASYGPYSDGTMTSVVSVPLFLDYSYYLNARYWSGNDEHPEICIEVVFLFWRWEETWG